MAIRLSSRRSEKASLGEILKLDSLSQISHPMKSRRFFKMHPHEEATIRAFFSPLRRLRWLESLSSPKRRDKILEKLNHCQDFDDRFRTLLSSKSDVVSLLKSHGSPKSCYVISSVLALDGCELELSEAISQTELAGWGTIISCIPGQLAYYYDECGKRRILLAREPA